MGLSSLTLGADLGPAPLVHAVLNDGTYESTGAQPAPNSGRRLPAIAEACGYADVHRVVAVDALIDICTRIRRTVSPLPPTFLDIEITDSSERMAPRISNELPDIFTAARAEVLSISHN